MEPSHNNPDLLADQLESKLVVTDSNPAAKKKSRTVYWGVHVDPTIVKATPWVKEALEKNTQLMPLEKMHTTLLFVGRKYNADEEIYVPDVGKECKMVISGHGISERALALKVENVVFVETNEPVKSFAVQQHVTVALAEGTKAVDSVKTLMGEGSVVSYTEPMILFGKLTQYFN